MTIEVDPELFHWLEKRFKRSGPAITEVALTHAKGGGAPDPICTFDRTQIDAYKDNKELCLELEERMTERCRFQGDSIVAFEVTIFGGKLGDKPLDNRRFERRGTGQKRDLTVDTAPMGQMTMYMREAHRDRELTISVLQKQIEVLERRNEKQYVVIDQMMARYPEMLELMNRLADSEVERDIRRRQAFRIEGIKDRVVQNLDKAVPHLLLALTGGKLNLLSAPSAKDGKGNPEMMAEIEPHLIVLMKSIAEAGERGLQIGALLNNEEQQRLIAIATIIDQYGKKEADPGIGVKPSNGAADATPPAAS